MFEVCDIYQRVSRLYKDYPTKWAHLSICRIFQNERLGKKGQDNQPVHNVLFWRHRGCWRRGRDNSSSTPPICFWWGTQSIHTPRIYPTAIPLIGFTESLFGQDAQALISEVLQSDTEMKALWKNGKVFFNHMVKLEKVPNEQTMELGFERGAAFFLPDGFHGADILIPVQVAGTDMTFFLIQVRNKKYDKATVTWRMRKLVVNWCCEVSQNGQKATFVWWCAFGVQASEASHGNAGDRLQIIVPRVQPRQSRQQKTSTTYWPVKEKRLVALVMGLDAQTYPSADTCMGKRIEESTRIVLLLQRLLDYIPKTPMPDGSEHDYVRQIKTLAV